MLRNTQKFIPNLDWHKTRETGMEGGTQWSAEKRKF